MTPLRGIKLVHTFAWAIFAAAIVAELIAVAIGALTAAAWLSVLVWVEVIVLFANRMHCPLTGMAERYTDDRSGNFDIFLPAWLAIWNKTIFGSLFALGEVLLLWRWLAG